MEGEKAALVVRSSGVSWVQYLATPSGSKVTHEVSKWSRRRAEQAAVQHAAAVITYYGPPL